MKYDISQMPQDVLECRDIGHSWVHEWTVLVTGASAQAERMLVCRRCTTYRRDLIDVKTGEGKGRSYAYGQGYQVLGVNLQRPEVRREAIRRALAALDVPQKARKG